MGETVSDHPQQRWIQFVTWILVAAAAAAVATGLLPFEDFGELAATTGPVLGFVFAMTIVAELSSVAGVFTVLAERLTIWGRGRVVALWVFVLVMVTLITAFMSLDTTAVLVTPIVVVLARRIGVSPLPFALATVWLANTGSLFLPVSNLTNLIAAGAFGRTPLDFIDTLWPPAVAGVIVTITVLTFIYRRSLSGRYTLTERTRISDRPLLVFSFIVVALLLPLLVSGLDVAIVAGIAALLLLIAFAIRNRNVLSFGLVPWQTLGFAASLFVLVQAAHAHGLGPVAASASGTGEGFWSLLQVAAVGALGANTVNNLPAFLALTSVAETPLRMGALLIGVNLAPLISPWASLATMLWHHRLTRMGVEVSWSKFALFGFILVLVIVPATVLVLSVS